MAHVVYSLREGKSMDRGMRGMAWKTDGMGGKRKG